MKANHKQKISWRIIALIAISCVLLLAACVLLTISFIKSRNDDAAYDVLVAIANSTQVPTASVTTTPAPTIAPIIQNLAPTIAPTNQKTTPITAPPNQSSKETFEPVVQTPIPTLTETLSPQKQSFHDYLSFYHELLKPIIRVEEILSSMIEDAVPTPTPEPEETPEPDYVAVKDYSSMKKNFDALLAINKDCIGWLQIEGTKINYPVVYSSNSQKYLSVGFDGKKNRNGTIFATGKGGASSRNITLYGHSMSNKEAMFYQLKKYKSQSFYNGHKDIWYSTSGGDYVYRIFAAFPIKITGHSFNYTQMNFLNDTDFEIFINTAMEYSVINTGETVPNGARILTLSTCEKGETRFVVMGYR